VVPFGLVATRGAVVRTPLDASGRDFLRRIWERECTRKSVTDRVSLRFENEWRVVPHKDTLAPCRHPEPRARAGGRSRRCARVRGSVLLDVDPGGQLVSVAPSDAAVRQPVLLTSNGRCDPHSRAESKQTFLFRVEVRIDNDRPVRVIVMPDRKMQVKALALLDKVCG